MWNWVWKQKGMEKISANKYSLSLLWNLCHFDQTHNMYGEKTFVHSNFPTKYKWNAGKTMKPIIQTEL